MKQYSFFRGKIDLDPQIRCVEREIAMRESAYPRWINAKKMSAGKAEYELQMMREVKRSLYALKDCYEWLSGMVETMNNEHAEHNKSLPIGNFESAMIKLTDKINGNADDE